MTTADLPTAASHPFYWRPPVGNRRDASHGLAIFRYDIADHELPLWPKSVR